MEQKMRDYSEDKVQVSIVQWLQLNGFIYTSTGAGLIKSMRTQITMKRLGYRAGSSDIIVFIKNGCLHIECKRPAGLRWSGKSNRLIYDKSKGKQSDAQKKFEEDITKIEGHYYLVATSVEEVSNFIKENKILPR